MSKPHSVNGSESEFEFIETPKAPTPTFEKFEDCGVRTTSVSKLPRLAPSAFIDCSVPRRRWLRCQLSNADAGQYPSIKNGPLPADAAGAESFSYVLLFSILGGVPFYMAWNLGGGLKTTIFFGIFTSIPLLSAFWIAASSLSPRKNEKAKYPGRPVEHYLTFKKPGDKAKYHGRSRIPMETFHEMYFDGDVDFNGDCLEVMEYRHDWATFRLTANVIKFFLFGMIPEVIMHTRSQGSS